MREAMKYVNVNGFDIIEVCEVGFDKSCKMAAEANSLKIGGHSDWGLPDTQTLRALALVKPEDVHVWSASPYVGFSNYAWHVGFGDGYVGYGNRSVSLHVRLVRASQCLALGMEGHRKSLEAAGIEVLTEQPAQQELVAES